MQWLLCSIVLFLLLPLVHGSGQDRVAASVVTLQTLVSTIPQDRHSLDASVTADTPRDGPSGVRNLLTRLKTVFAEDKAQNAAGVDWKQIRSPPFQVTPTPFLPRH